MPTHLLPTLNPRDHTIAQLFPTNKANTEASSSPYQHPRAYGTDDPSRSYTTGYAGDQSPLLGTPRSSTDNVGTFLPLFAIRYVPGADETRDDSFPVTSSTPRRPPRRLWIFAMRLSESSTRYSPSN